MPLIERARVVTQRPTQVLGNRKAEGDERVTLRGDDVSVAYQGLVTEAGFAEAVQKGALFPRIDDGLGATR
ncbi:MAG: hypothetical protein AVDCRST_MAG86-2338 [uncultured Truepera sp.]|uniref:Uncharacterized protein n=1 Tax=uncultured Truepera sp. TaxID=543023 RepID=A0A6J4VE96_9DEIN|nr:MAG: hypothetical protein AVDCRST_MAG86-2338 [uncultured Truepera sp.]